MALVTLTCVIRQCLAPQRLAWHLEYHFRLLHICDATKHTCMTIDKCNTVLVEYHNYPDIIIIKFMPDSPVAAVVIVAPW